MKVKRSLFGEVDHEALKIDLRQELKRDVEERSKMWNFNFFDFLPMGKENGLDWKPISTPVVRYEPGSSLVTSICDRDSFKSIGLLERIHPSASTNIREPENCTEKSLDLDSEKRLDKDTEAKSTAPSESSITSNSQTRSSPDLVESREADHDGRSPKQIDEDDDVRILKIVTVSPTPTRKSNNPPAKESKSIRFSNRLKANSPSTVSSSLKRKRSIQTNTIHDYMKQKKPRRMSLDSTKPKLISTRSSTSHLFNTRQNTAILS